MIGKARHLPEDRLFDCYLAMCAGDVADPPAAEHLADCPGCRQRYEELVAFMEDVRVEGAAEADGHFTAEMLQRQRQQILNKIDHLNRPARVISFPGRVTRQIAAGSRRIAPQWLTAAAAAGLLVGIGVGGTFFERGLPQAERTMRSAVGPAMTVPRVTQPAVLVGNPAPLPEKDDDAFLVELEFALERSFPSELQPFDALTPHARETGDRLR